MTGLSEHEHNFFLFLEAGFVAINQADEDSAVKLFKACEILNKENSLIRVGMGYLHLHKLELKAAKDIFEEVLQKEPDNEMAKTFLGITLSLTPNQTATGEQMLEKVAKGSEDKEIKNVASTTLDFVENFVKKVPGPAELKRK